MSAEDSRKRNSWNLIRIADFWEADLKSTVGPYEIRPYDSDPLEFEFNKVFAERGLKERFRIIWDRSDNPIAKGIWTLEEAEKVARLITVDEEGYFCLPANIYLFQRPRAEASIYTISFRVSKKVVETLEVTGLIECIKSFGDVSTFKVVLPKEVYGDLPYSAKIITQEHDDSKKLTFQMIFIPKS